MGVKRDGEKQQAWLRMEMIVYVQWKEVGSLITPLVFVSAFPNLVADDSYARSFGFHGYLYPNVLA